MFWLPQNFFFMHLHFSVLPPITGDIFHPIWSPFLHFDSFPQHSHVSEFPSSVEFSLHPNIQLLADWTSSFSAKHLLVSSNSEKIKFLYINIFLSCYHVFFSCWVLDRVTYTWQSLFFSGSLVFPSFFTSRQFSSLTILSTPTFNTQTLPPSTHKHTHMLNYYDFYELWLYLLSSVCGLFPLSIF